MSRPPLNPERTAAGIVVDPHTLQRVIPESRRPDGTVRKQLKVRPGFTPQEDVRRFRGTKQAQMDASALPKGHIIGWAPPPTSTASSSSDGTKPMTKSAKKNAKRKEKRDKEKAQVPDDWEDDEDNPNPPPASTINTANPDAASTEDSAKPPSGSAKDTTEELASKLDKLDVK